MKKLILLFLLMPFLVLAQEKNDETLAAKICSLGYSNWGSSVPVSGFEEDILSYIGISNDDPNREKHIAKFFNENNHLLICGEDNDEFIRPNEHILKRSIALSEYDFLLHAANSPKYDDMDWNFYEIVDGKKETILDYLDMIINDEELAIEYDVDELKSLMRVLEQNDAKRGKDL